MARTIDAIELAGSRISLDGACLVECKAASDRGCGEGARSIPARRWRLEPALANGLRFLRNRTDALCADGRRQDGGFRSVDPKRLGLSTQNASRRWFLARGVALDLVPTLLRKRFPVCARSMDLRCRNRVGIHGACRSSGPATSREQQREHSRLSYDGPHDDIPFSSPGSRIDLARPTRGP